MNNSFFKKLKKGMGIKQVVNEEEPEEEIKEEPEEETKKEQIKEIPIELEVEKEKKPELKKMPKKEKVKMKKPLVKEEERWPETEGQLAIDVYQTESHLVVRSAIAGIKPEVLDISIEGDLLTIRGERKRPIEENEDYFFQECYWGQFSRQIILPVEVNPNQVEATLKQGILTIRVPKILREKKRKIIIKED